MCNGYKVPLAWSWAMRIPALGVMGDTLVVIKAFRMMKVTRLTC